MAAVAVALGVAACSHEAPEPPLGRDEEALVQAYVRLTVVQALHETIPDSTAAILKLIGTQVDTVAVHRALTGLAKDPMRWELVYAAIASRLEDLEESPSLWWGVARGDSVRVPPRPEAPPSGRTPVPNR